MFERGVVVVQWDNLNKCSEVGPWLTAAAVETDNGAIFADWGEVRHPGFMLFEICNVTGKRGNRRYPGRSKSTGQRLQIDR